MESKPSTTTSMAMKLGAAMLLGAVIGAGAVMLLSTKPPCPPYFKKKDGNCFFVSGSGANEVWTPIPCPDFCIIP